MTSTVRITADHFSSGNFTGQAVRAVGKLLAVDAQAGQVQLELPGTSACSVTVTCPQGTHKYLLEQVGKGYYEVIGTLQGGDIQEMNVISMGENFDTEMYVEMVKLTHEFPNIF